MPLHKHKIQEIKDFIHSRGFTHIEVEMEILDHVASAVEAKLEANSNKSITKAIDEVHTGFGPLGFSVMEDEFRKSYVTQFRTIQLDLIRDYFWSSKAGFTILIFLIGYMIGQMILPQPIHIIQIVLSSICLISGFGLYIYFRKMFKEWRKRSLILGSQFVYFWFVYYLIIYGLQFFGEWFLQTPKYNGLIFALILTVILVSTLFSKDMIKAAFNWTNERYLKYAAQ